MIAYDPLFDFRAGGKHWGTETGALARGDLVFQCGISSRVGESPARRGAGPSALSTAWRAPDLAIRVRWLPEVSWRASVRVIKP